MEPQNASAAPNISNTDSEHSRNPVQLKMASETSNEASSTDSTSTEVTASDPAIAASVATEPKPSYVKLAMRNMVRKRGTSLMHFALTATGLLAVLVGLAYLTR